MKLATSNQKIGSCNQCSFGISRVDALKPHQMDYPFGLMPLWCWLLIQHDCILSVWFYWV